MCPLWFTPIIYVQVFREACMNFEVIGLTVETKGMSAEQLEHAKVFSGKNAGICYMGDSYFDSKVTDPEKAAKRFHSTVNNAHHSIADHIRVEVLLENVSKMLAIILNSLQDYATSEKSGRYTIMTGNSVQERALYEKWCKIYEKCILKEEPNINDKWLQGMLKKKYPGEVYSVKAGRISSKGFIQGSVLQYFDDVLLKSSNLPSKKKAQENARYVLSIFTKSTTMGYSTSLRQWNYIYDWCQKFLSQYEEKGDKIVYKGTDRSVTYFEKELYSEILALGAYIHLNLYVDDLRDTKDRHFQFLVGMSGQKEHEMSYYDMTGVLNGDISADDELELVYSVAYPASFVHIAQAERHRTLKYFMYFDPKEELQFFVPPIIRDTDYEFEWLRDLESVAEFVPQATLIGIVETGHICDFLLKCEERLCSRAQWEIMEQTKNTAQRFINAAGIQGKSKAFEKYVEKLMHNGDVATKCQMLCGCKEGCGYTPKYALTRKF